VEIDSTVGPFDVSRASLLADERLYSGRIIRDRSGTDVLLAFLNSTTDGDFVGTLSNPIPIGWAGGGGAIALTEKAGRA
jgi:beta-fructofuranosidase